MGDEKIFTARFKVEDDGSIVLDKISGKLVDVGKKGEESLGKITSSLSIIKLDSLINLGERAFHAGEQLYNMGRNIASSTMEIERNAKIAGLSTDIYQKMAYAAKMTDVDIESLGKGMKILAGHMDDVAKGKGEAISLFQSIGVSTTDASGKMKSFDEMLGDLADRFKSMPDGVQKVALAVDLFGKSGQNLIPYLNQGKSGIEAFYREAEKMGIVLDESVIRKGAEAEDTFKKLEAQVNAMKLSLAPLALEAANFFASLVKDAKEAGDKVAAAAEKIRAASAKAMESQEEWRRKRGYPGALTGEGLGIKQRPAASMFAFADIGLEQLGEAPAYLRQSEAALKAMAAANDKIIDQNYKLSDFYEYETNVLKGQVKLREDQAKSLDLMAELGVKTQKQAEKEIDAVKEKFRTILTGGFSTGEIEEARKKLQEELQKIGETYAKPSGWQLTAEGEGGIKVWSNIRAEAGGLEEKTRLADEELSRMATNAERLGQATNKVMIDATSFNSANQAIDTLRIKLESMTERTWPITIAITGTGSSELPIMEKIQEIYNSFNSLPQSLRGLAVNISLKDLNDQIYALQGQMATTATMASPIGWAPGAYAKYALGTMQPQLEYLMMMQRILQAYQAQAGGGGGGGGGNVGEGVSININTINVSGGGSAEIAEQLDAQLAVLWEKDRSKLKQAIKG